MIDPKMTSRQNLPRFSRAAARFAGRARASLVAAAIGLSLLWPAPAPAQEEEVKYDARLDGYETKMHLDSDNTALTWLLLVALSMVALGVMFKNAKRTHLD